MCARWCITHKRMHACAIRNRTCVQCVYCRLGFGMVAWDAGKTVTETGTWSCCDAACCVQAQRNTLQESEHSERKKERKKERAYEEDTKEAFIHSGFEFAVNGADAAVDLNSNFIAQERVSLVLKPHSACFTTEYVKT